MERLLTRVTSEFVIETVSEISVIGRVSEHAAPENWETFATHSDTALLALLGRIDLSEPINRDREDAPDACARERALELAGGLTRLLDGVCTA